VALLAAVYFGAARLGLAMAFAAEHLTAVWPPTGIALATTLCLGYRAWPDVAPGAFSRERHHRRPSRDGCGPTPTPGASASPTPGPPQRQAILQTLQHWQQDTDLARVRDPKALAPLPAEERDGWHKFWADVAGLARRAGMTK
jgi:hypothetical protein